MAKEPMPPKGSLELYDKAKKMHKDIYKKDCWNKEKYTRKVGFQLRGTFGPQVWTFKDLEDDQLEEIINQMSEKIKRHPRLLAKIALKNEKSV